MATMAPYPTQAYGPKKPHTVNVLPALISCPNLAPEQSCDCACNAPDAMTNAIVNATSILWTLVILFTIILLSGLRLLNHPFHQLVPVVSIILNQ